jgi:hypothetical protein
MKKTGKRLCSKGKACGATCIAKSKICRKELGVVGGSLASVRNNIKMQSGQPEGSRVGVAPPPVPGGKGKEKIEFSGKDLMVGGKVYKPGKTLPGSTSPTLYTDENGKGKWVVKEGGAKGQNNVEKASNDVYRILGKTLGVGAVDSNLVDGKLVNRFVEGGRTIDSLSKDERSKLDVNGQMRRSFIGDALVGNWDFMGALRGDNVMVDSRGKVTRIDAGGTFNYRAMGEKKPFGPIPTDVWSLRERQGKEIWAGAKDSDYRHLWTNQVNALRENARALRQSVESSGMDPKASRAFTQRMAALVMAGNLIATTNLGGKTVQQLADEGKISWKQVDAAMKNAFENSSGSPSSKGWGKALRNEIVSELQGLL